MRKKTPENPTAIIKKPTGDAIYPTLEKNWAEEEIQLLKVELEIAQAEKDAEQIKFTRSLLADLHKEQKISKPVKERKELKKKTKKPNGSPQDNGRALLEQKLREAMDNDDCELIDEIRDSIKTLYGIKDVGSITIIKADKNPVETPIKPPKRKIKYVVTDPQKTPLLHLALAKRITQRKIRQKLFKKRRHRRPN